MKLGPRPVVPDVAQFALHTQVSGGPTCLTRFFMKYSLAMSQGDALTLITTLASSWGTRFGPITSQSYTLIQTSVIDLGSRTGVNVFLPVSHAGIGAGTQTAATSFIMSAKVPLRYKGGHSRVYIPGIQSSEMSDANSWSTTAQGLVNTAWTGMLSDLASSPPNGVGQLTQVTVRFISSDKRDFNPPPATFPALLEPPMVLAVNSWAPNPQLGSQRRRNQQ